MTCAPVDHLAIGLLINSEMNAPPKPMTAANSSSVPRLSPALDRKRLRPSTLTTMLSTSITARLVRMNRMTRFMTMPSGTDWEGHYRSESGAPLRCNNLDGKRQTLAARKQPARRRPQTQACSTYSYRP